MMIDQIKRHFLSTSSSTGISEPSEEIIEAFHQVPRHAFVPIELRELAYDDTPLTIGLGQTISQPFIVALMTSIICPEPHHRVLEVGTGSGYQSAILSQLVQEVYSVEIIKRLAVDATERLKKLGYENIIVKNGDGYSGIPEHAPYNGIVVTACARHIPPALVEQLAKGGRMIIPVGLPHSSQNLMLVTKDEFGKVSSKNILAVVFVPLTGGH